MAFLQGQTIAVEILWNSLSIYYEAADYSSNFYKMHAEISAWYFKGNTWKEQGMGG